jgi:hypothetical protein
MLTAVIRRALSALAALLLALAPLLGLSVLVSPPAAEAFYPQTHIRIFRETLRPEFNYLFLQPGAMPRSVASVVEEGLERNDALRGHLKPEWHFDSAQDPVAICKLWEAGPGKLLEAAANAAVEAFRKVPSESPLIAEHREPGNRYTALRSYGQYLHAIHDFYTHSNWLELHLDPAKPHTLKTRPGPAPIQAACNAEELVKQQPQLESGYFNLLNPPDFCALSMAPRPLPVPPAGFNYCHGPPDPVWYVRLFGPSRIAPELILAKDLPHLYHGAEVLTLPDGSQTTYHEEAVRLATEATPETFRVFHDRVVARLREESKPGKALPNRDPECLFRALITGSDSLCPAANEFKGDSQKLNQPMLAEDWGPPGQLVIKSMHAEISLGPARTAEGFTVRDITGGAMSFEVEIWQDGRLHETQSFATSPDPNVPAASGNLLIFGDRAQGTVEFTGTWQSTLHQDPPVAGAPVDAFPEVFSVVMDSESRLVLCRTEAMALGSGVDEDVAYQQCLERALVVLEPTP